MSAVDCPPGLGLGGRAAGEFGARPGPQRLARRAFRYVVVLGLLAMWLAARRPAAPQAATLIILPLMLIAIAGLGIAVRTATVAIDRDGVRWGWSIGGFRLDRSRLTRIDIYRDAVAMRQARGSTWFLSARDWDRFDALTRAVGRAGLPATSHDQPAPLAARLQSYGRVLDGLLVLAMVAVTIVLLAAF